MVAALPKGRCAEAVAVLSSSLEHDLLRLRGSPDLAVRSRALHRRPRPCMQSLAAYGGGAAEKADVSRTLLYARVRWSTTCCAREGHPTWRSGRGLSIGGQGHVCRAWPPMVAELLRGPMCRGRCCTLKFAGARPVAPERGRPRSRSGRGLSIGGQWPSMRRLAADGGGAAERADVPRPLLYAQARWSTTCCAREGHPTWRPGRGLSIGGQTPYVRGWPPMAAWPSMSVAVARPAGLSLSLSRAT
jgi:hypothetical protein